MPQRLLALLTGGLLLGCAAPAVAAPASVTVRAEGSAATLVPRTTVRTDTRPVNKDGTAGHDCTGTSAAGALELATGGDWSGTWFDGLGYSVERIRAETHAFPEPDFYELRVNNRAQSVGVCGVELQQGDDVLFFVARCEVGPAPDFACQNPPVLPLGLRVPATVRPGTPFNVTVVEYASDGTPAPVAGAAVSGGDAAATTDAAGVATVTLGSGGGRTLQATMPGRARSAAEPVCATTGTDGLCGTVVASAGPVVARDRTAPKAAIRGIRDGRRFRRGRGPRTLQVRVAADDSGLFAVKLRLTRTSGRRCSYFSGRSERFRAARCGVANGKWFAVGDRQDVDYLLPSRLPRGRYVLDVTAIDKAFNRDTVRRRGANRVVFHVG